MTPTELTAAVSRRIQTARPLLIAVDGMYASGKSTWAKRFCAGASVPLVHIDDFFRPAGADGIPVDAERFLAEVIQPFEAGKAITYRPFSCQRQVWEDAVSIPPTDILMVEGVYCLHPLLRPHYGLTVFFTIDPETQKKRILARNGGIYLRRFLEEWIPNEHRYFETYGIKASCGLLAEG